MQSEEQRRYISGKPIQVDPERQAIDRIGDQNMESDISEMPAARLQSEDAVVEPQPEQKNRAVIRPRRVWIQVTPHMLGEESRQEVPGMHIAVADDLLHIIVDKVIVQRTDEGNQRDSQHDQDHGFIHGAQDWRCSQARPSSQLDTRLCTGFNDLRRCHHCLISFGASPPRLILRAHVSRTSGVPALRLTWDCFPQARLPPQASCTRRT